MRFSMGVFIIDGFLALLLMAVGSWPFSLIAAFIAGAVACWLWRERRVLESEELCWRFRRADQQGQGEVEAALHESERRRFARPIKFGR